MKRRVAVIALVLASVCLSWLGAEWVVAKAGVLEYPPAMTRGHPTRGYTLRPGFRGETSLGVPIEINAQGLRSPAVAVPKQAGTLRVLVLGDSVTFGAGVREDETFSRQLETLLRGDLACPVEVVNAGVSGYGSVEEADLLEHEGLALEPDVVLVFHVENDNVAVPHLQGGLASFVKDRVVYRSHLIGASLIALRRARWMLQASNAGGDANAFGAEQAAWDQRSGTPASLDALRRIASVAHANGASVLLASYPATPRNLALDEKRHAILRDLAASTDMRFLETGPALAPHVADGLAVSAADLHPNGRAHRLIAEALRPALRDALHCPAAGAGHS